MSLALHLLITAQAKAHVLSKYPLMKLLFFPDFLCVYP